MTLRLVSKKLVPIDLALALKFRDMMSLKGERPLTSSRVKGQARLLADNQLFTMLWGQCEYEGDLHRGNGNHTSHLLAACFQAHGAGLDEKSQRFVQEHLFTRGGDWTGESPQDLPFVKEGHLYALVETFEADEKEDLVTFFRRYDDAKSARTSANLVGVYAGEHEDLDDLHQNKVVRALSGALRAAKVNPEMFGFQHKKDLALFSGQATGAALGISSIRECVRWIITTVPYDYLYSKQAGAQVLAEVWAEHGEDGATRVVERLVEQIDAERDPGEQWASKLTRKGASPTLESLVERGRRVMAQIVKQVLKPVPNGDEEPATKQPRRGK